MTINFTVVVQIIHFWVAYWILDMFLFPYVFKAIEKDTAYKQFLENQKQKEEKQLVHIKSEKERQWHAFRNNCFQIVPEESIDTVEKAPYPFMPIVQIDEKKIEHEVDHIKSALMKEISHVR